MKKISKIISALISSALLLFLLSGCDYIDKMREAQAFFETDGSITYKGSTYRSIPVKNGFNPIEKGGNIYITKPQVPVLLSERLGDYAFLSYDEAIINKDNGCYYCRDDIRSDLLEEMENPTINNYIYYKGEYNEYGYYETERVSLTKEEVDAIKAVLETVEPYELNVKLYASKSVEISCYSENLYFFGGFLSLGLNHNDIVITVKNEIDYRNDNDYEIYEVPEEYEEILRNLVSKANGE